MLPVPPIRQTTAMCGPACLVMVMSYWGTSVPLARIIRVSGATRTRGLLPEGFRRAARVFGFSVRIQDNASFHDIRMALRAGVPPIVNWFSEDEGHYSVVVRMTRSHIVLLDPEHGELRTISKKIFERVWFGVDPEPARTIRDFHLRRLLFVQPRV